MLLPAYRIHENSQGKTIMKNIATGVCLNVKLFALAGSLLLAACMGPNFSQLEKGSLRILEGEVDNVMRSEIPYDKKILSLTSVGFANGQGITLVGIQPGVNKGKQVRVTAEFIGNINGTDVFTVKQISALKAPEVEIIPAPAPAVTITPTPTAAVQETVKSPAPVISPQPVAATVAEPPKSPGQ